jgi:hypothetical protein
MKLALIVLVAFLTTMFSGCVVAPVGPGYGGPYGVAYVAPTFAIPGPGYVWAYHAGFGWGWHHPQYGWRHG